MTRSPNKQFASNNSKFNARIIAIEKKNSEKVMEDVLWVATQTKRIERENYLATFSGRGIAGPGKLIHTPEEEAAAQVQPLANTIKNAVRMMFGAVLMDILHDPELRTYYLGRMSRLQGKKGGRPGGRQTAHIAWLEEKLRRQENLYSDAIPAFTAEDHFDAIRELPGIDGEDDAGSLTFCAGTLEEFGWREGRAEPKITINSVREVLTRIRKGNSP